MDINFCQPPLTRSIISSVKQIFILIPVKMNDLIVISSCFWMIWSRKIKIRNPPKHLCGPASAPSPTSVTFQNRLFVFLLLLIHMKQDGLNSFMFHFHILLLVTCFVNMRYHQFCVFHPFVKDIWMRATLTGCQFQLPLYLQLGQSSHSKKLSRLFLGHFWTKIWSDNCFEIVLTYRMA